MDWFDWIETAMDEFRAMQPAERWLSAATIAAAIWFAMVFWSRFGNRRTAVKCLGLALMIHFIAWGYAERFDLMRHVRPAAPQRPKEMRMPIAMKTDRENAVREVESLRRFLKSAVEQARLPTETLSKNEAVRIHRTKPMENLEPQFNLPSTAPMLNELEKSKAPTPADRFEQERTSIEKLAAAPAKELSLSAAPPALSTPPVEAAVSRRSLDLPDFRPSLPPDAVPAEPSPVPLGPTVERLAPIYERPAAGISPNATLAELGEVVVAPPSRRGGDDARPPKPKASKLWTEEEILKAGSAGKNRDIQLVLNRSELNRRKLLAKHGGTERTERAVQEALAWLAAHQDPSGKWSCTEFGDRCPPGSPCDGKAIEHTSDVGVTGLALLAFLGAGHTTEPGDIYADVIQRGFDWMLGQQRLRGHLMGEGNMYSHAMATLALTEILLLTGDRRYRLAAQQAVDFLVAAQHPNTGGWRYAPKEFGDTSVYGWVVLALRSGEQANLSIPASTWRQARRWLELVSSGAHRGLASYQPNYSVSPAMTAEAMVCRQILGTPRQAKELEEAGEFLMKHLPEVGEHHLYYWYYGTIGMFQLGGPHWERWNVKLMATLLDTQEKTGHLRGSWEPKKPFGVDGGRVFSTACSALCLEVYYRYLPLYDESGIP